MYNNNKNIFKINKYIALKKNIQTKKNIPKLKKIDKKNFD